MRPKWVLLDSGQDRNCSISELLNIKPFVHPQNFAYFLSRPFVLLDSRVESDILYNLSTTTLMVILKTLYELKINHIESEYGSFDNKIENLRLLDFRG